MTRNSFDRQPLEQLKAGSFFDEATVRWYRRVLPVKAGKRPAEMGHVDFLLDKGFLVESGGRWVPTLAAVLLFGKDRYVRRGLGRMVYIAQINCPAFAHLK